jgi:DNA-binding NarL/FixJ family response regulator
MEGADLIILDLSRPGVSAAVADLRRSGSQARIVGFVSHVDDVGIEMAKAAGCDEVLPRSRFFARLARQGISAFTGPDSERSPGE